MNEQTPLPQQQWPRLRLDFYSSAVLMSRWKDDGRLATYPVSVHDVVSACTNVQLSSGLLPASTLFWKQRANQTILGIYVPARCWKVQTEDRSYHVPMPPFVFVGCGSSYYVFAIKKRPSNELDQLYHAPCPNVHTHGGICQGNTPFPICSLRNIQTTLTLFLEGSLFNADLSRGKCQSHPEDVRELWAELDGRKRFPLSELVPAQMTLWNLV
jgi:PRTRC genetic system protein B